MRRRTIRRVHVADSGGVIWADFRALRSRLMPALRPCPFCERLEAVTIARSDAPSVSASHRVECIACGCEGPLAATVREAAIAWNRR